MKSREGNRVLWIMLILMALAFYFFSHWIFRPISPDERYYLALGMKIYKEGRYETLKGNPEIKVPPLHPLMLAGAYKVFGPSVDSAQSVSMIFGVLTVGLVYLMGRSLWDPGVGALAALLLITSAKGTFWQYSNRVLSEVHLAFFLSMALFWATLYVRKGSKWMILPMGASVGLGLLVKEFAVLAVLSCVLACILRKGSLKEKVCCLIVMAGVVAFFVLPWLIHVNGVAGSPIAGLMQRGKGHAIEALRDAHAWGMRSPRELLRMVSFFGRPAWFSQLVWGLSLAFMLYTCVRKRSSEGIILVVAVISWFGAFAFFKALPLNLRRLVPLLPLSAILSSYFLMTARRWLLNRTMGKGGLSKTVKVASVVLLGIILVNDLKPTRTMKHFDPFCIACSERRPFLEREVRSAIRCIPSGARVATNYKSLLYFYSGGTLRPFGLPLTLDRRRLQWMGNKPLSQSDVIRGGLIYDFKVRGHRIVLDEPTLLRAIAEGEGEFIAFIDSGVKKWAPPALSRYFRDHPKMFKPVCVEEMFQVYEISRDALKATIR